jgi:hypothetical protein
MRVAGWELMVRTGSEMASLLKMIEYVSDKIQENDQGELRVSQ